MSTIKVNAITDTSGGSNVSVPNAAKAWVNFNGTGTVAIRASFNVSSITDNGTGVFTVNFTTAMTDANYAVFSTAGEGTVNGKFASGFYSAPASSSFQLQTNSFAGGLQDQPYVTLGFFR